MASNIEEPAKSEELGTIITKKKALEKPTGIKKVQISDIKHIVYPPGFEEKHGKQDDPIPGEIELDLSGKVFKKYLILTGYSFLMDSWNDFLLKDLPNCMGSINLKLRNDTIIKFTEVKRIRPILLPGVALKTGATYENTIELKAIAEDKSGKQIMEKNVKVFNIPVMLGSADCWTVVANRNYKKIEAMGLSPADPLGYFIIRGKKKFIKLYQYLLQNEILVYTGPRLTPVKPSQAKIRFQARLTYETSVRSVVTYLEMGKKGNIKCYFPFFDKKTKTNKGTNTEEIKGNVMMPIFSFIRIFHVLFSNQSDTYLTREDYISFITRMVLPERREKIAQVLQGSLHAVLGNPEENVAEGIANDFEYYRKKSKLTKVSDETLEKFFRNGIEHGFFPFIKHETDKLGSETNYLNQRFDLFCLMIARMCEVKAGLRRENDRDSWTNSKVMGPGERMTKRLRSYWYAAMQEIQTKIEEEKITDPKQALDKLSDLKITQGIVSNFASGNWSIRDENNGKDITAPLKSDHPIQMTAELTRVKAKINDKSKNMKHRESKPDQWGFIDMNQTPEGAECGAVKNLAKGARFSRSRDDILLRNFLGDKNRIKTESDEKYRFIVLINSKPIGWTPESTFTELKNAKVRGILPYDTGIVKESNVINIHTDGCRLIRPLFLLDESGRLVIEKLATSQPDIWERDFNYLRTSGCIEFIDTKEQEYTVIATRIDDIIFKDELRAEAQKNFIETERWLKDPKSHPDYNLEVIGNDETPIPEIEKRFIAKLELDHIRAKRMLKNSQKVAKYTHCELNPRSSMSLSVSLEPFANHSPAVRIAYGAKHEEQSVGALISNHPDLFESSMKLLMYPSRSFLETEISSMVGLDDAPRGKTVFLAVMPGFGWNQEDSYLFNEDLVDLGIFDTFKYKPVEHVLDEKAEEEYRIPNSLEHEQKAYRWLDKNGIPRVNAQLGPGDCILGIVRRNKRDKNRSEDISEYMGNDPEDAAIVDRVEISNNGNNVRIKLRQYRSPQIGDKFSASPGQKGVISQVLPSADMPFISAGPMKGVAISVCMNPLSFPTRMTVGTSMEMVAGSVAALIGKRLNASAFLDFDIDFWERTLLEYGYTPNGMYRLQLGTTGRFVNAMIFSGPIYLRKLKHEVVEKFQNRSIGKIDPLTGQPLKGRKEFAHAIKLGEMERDCLLGLGAAAFINERLFISSDRSQVIVCNNCRTIADVMQEFGIRCKICSSKDFRKINVPVIYQRWMSTLQTGNIVFYHETEISNKDL